MSDDGLMNVEDETPPAVVAAVVPPVAVAPPEPPAAEPPEEPDAIEVNGQRMVPVGTLIEERKQRQAFQKEAAKVADLEAFARDARPYVEFLKANPGLQRQQPVAPVQPPAAVADPHAELIAKTMDLYTPDGKPDLARGAVMSGLVKTVAREMAQGLIAPIQQESAQTQSARNYQVALSIKDKDGNSPSPQALTQIWRTMDPRQTADPNVASILALTALGLDRVSGQKTPAVAPLQPLLVTEGPGAVTRRPALSVLETNIARDRGITETKWAENTKGFASGRPTQLED